jgi:hypothetical protein
MNMIQIRKGHENGEEVTFTEAVVVAMSIDPRNFTILHVVAVDPGTGKAEFGIGAELRPREVRYGQDDDATVSIGGIASHSPEVAMVRAECYMLAAQIAAAANAAANAAGARAVMLAAQIAAAANAAKAR